MKKETLGRELRKDGSLAVKAIKKFSADQCTTLSASIAFYSAFSLAPMLLMVIAVISWFLGAEAARGQLYGRIHGFLGDDAAAAIQSIVEHAHQNGGGGFAAIMSVVLLIIGASATFSSLNTALDVVFPTPPKQKASSIAVMVRVRLISFGLVLGVAFLLIVSLVLDTVVSFIGNMVWGNSPFVVIGDIVQLLLSLVVLGCAFAALLKLLPDAHVQWRHAFLGGGVAALLFSGGKKLFAMYLAHAGTASAFGAAGSLAVLLMWLYFSSAVLLVGAEFAAVRGGFGKTEGEAEGKSESGDEQRVLGKPSSASQQPAAATPDRVGSPVVPTPAFASSKAGPSPASWAGRRAALAPGRPSRATDLNIAKVAGKLQGTAVALARTLARASARLAERQRARAARERARRANAGGELGYAQASSQHQVRNALIASGISLVIASVAGKIARR